MRLAEITRDETHCHSSLMPNAEADFNSACQTIESGNWDKAYAMFEMLARDAIPFEIANAARTMSDILDPANTPNETVAKIAQLFPGKAFRVYDDEHGWYDGAMRELVEVQRRFSEPPREPHSGTASGPSTIL